MPEYLSPGVYVEEVSTGPKPIEGVSTSVAGFIGPTERGPEEPELITSWLAYKRWFGEYTATSHMAFAIQGFFDNGGKKCFVARVVSTKGKLAQGPDLPLRSVANGRGLWGNNIFLIVKNASNTADRAKDWFRVVVMYFRTVPGKVLDPTVKENLRDKEFVAPDVLEDFDNLTHLAAANNAKTTINLGSKLIYVDWKENKPAKLDELAPTRFTTGEDGDALALEDYQGGDFENGIGGEALLGQSTGFAAFEKIDEISLVVAPDHLDVSQLTDEVVNHCEKLRDRFAILGSKRGAKTDTRPTRDTTFGAQYHPWIHVYNPMTREDDYPIPAVGHVAGVYARTDIDSGVHKAPANAVLVGAVNLDTPVPKAVQDFFNPVGIDCIRDFRPDGRGIRVWGARTMSSDPEWKYVNVRRLFLFIEESIDEGTQWVVFEPNNDETWGRVVRSVTGFLTTVWRSGALFGRTPQEAFFVKCDRTTMTQDDIDNGRLICLIGIAPVKPAEFVIFRIGQKTADATQ